jgi:hypothetical protein
MMKRILFIFLCVFLSKSGIYAQNDTLRIYNPSNTSTTTYRSDLYPFQIARFDLPYPAFIKGFVLTLKGNTGSSLKMHLYGHEGGVSLPSLLSDLIEPIRVYKTNDDKEEVYVPLEEPYVFMNNSQFFMAFDSFDGALIITDRSNHSIACESSSGGSYRYQFARAADGTFYLLHNDNRAFAIDVILEYPTKESEKIFQDKTAEAGIATNLSNSTIACADLNDDGFIDLLIRGKLYMNNKNGTFTDKSADYGLNDNNGVVANAMIDMDNDGDLDIILFAGKDTSLLFINNNMTFTKKTLNVPKCNSFLSFSFADINNDNYPDLFISQLWDAYPEAQPNFFLLNDGNNDFTDNTSMIYPEYDGTWNYPNGRWDPPNAIIERNRNSRGSQWVDFDNDGDMDLYVANYFLHQDEFYRNNGNGTFTDICVEKGIDRNAGGANHGTGVDWFDYNNDTYMDLLLPQFAHPRFIAPYDHRGTAIYRNEGPPDYNFTDIVGQYAHHKGLISPSGLQLEETHAGGAWGDANNDGLADFLMSVFYGCRYIDFYEQQHDNTFQLQTFKYGLSGINTGTDLVWFDYDNNGRLDLAFANNGKFVLYQNARYNTRNYVQLDLRSSSANTYAIGARVQLYAGSKVYTREISAGRGQKMQNPYRLHFGLDYNFSIDSVVVSWPSNPRKKETFTGLDVNNIYKLSEGGSVQLSVDFPQNSSILRVYPNPASEQLLVTLELNEGQDFELILSDMNGKQKLLIKQGRSTAYPIETIVDIKDLSPGMYLMQVNTGNKNVREKLMIIR